MSYVTTRDNVQLYVKDWGTGRPVILIHGWPLSSDSFDDLAKAIADAGMRAIAYDRRGFGRSEQPWSGYDYDTLTDDLAAVIEGTGGHSPTLVGFSMGGGEVARYFSRFPAAAVTSAVFISAVTPYMMRTGDNPDGVDAGTFETMAAGITADRANFFAGFFKDFYGVGMLAKPVSTEVLEWSRQTALQASLEATLQCANSFATEDFRPDVAAIRVPTLILHGTADKIVPIDATSRTLAAAVPNSRLIEYDGAPHGVFASHKAQLIADVLSFLGRRATVDDDASPARVEALASPDLVI